MDIGRSAVINSQQGIMKMNENWNQSAFQDNKDVVSKYNNSVMLADAKGKYGQIKGDVEGGAGGVHIATSGAKQFSNAKNFDSEVAGFGTGKGPIGYLKSQPQIIKGQFAKGKSVLQKAGGGAGIDTTNPRAMGLTQRVHDTYPATDTTTGESTTVKIGKDVPAGEGAGKALKVGGDITEEAVAAQSAKASGIAKASGGLITDVGGGAAGTGGAEGIIKKIGGGLSDMPVKQLGAVADIGAKGIGIYGMVSGIADLAGGHTSGLDKAKDVGDIVAGSLDTAALAVPILAPIAGVASLIAGIGDIFDSAKEKKASVDTAKTQETASTQMAKTGTSLSSMGEVAKTQISAN